jgi:amino acid adenylation domain-containing protein
LGRRFLQKYQLANAEPASWKDDVVMWTKAETDQSVASRFELIAQKHAGRPAVVFGEQTSTYVELNRLSNRIGHVVDGLSADEQQPVAILMSCGINQIAAILGVLKSAQIYVAIDPADPVDRLKSVLSEAGVALIVTDSTQAALAVKLTDGKRQVLDVDTLEDPGTAENLDKTILPGAPAYIFYTSGTTGSPKGVVDSHRNVLHNIMRYTNNLQIHSDDRLTLLQACSFSGSVSSMFCALLNGATLFPFDVRENGVGALAAMLVEQKVTIYHSVPSLLEQVVRTGRSFPDIRVVRLEGDRCTPKHVALFRQHFQNDCMLANGLGATETGLSHQYLIGPRTDIGASSVPVGYPAQDFEAVVLDEAGREISGAAGQLAIISEFLATGYWKNDELTRQTFRPVPGTSKRMYLSGDVGRVRSDGRLEHLGRRDFQVKIRGNRVDTEALEVAIAGISGVDHAVVQGHRNGLGHQQLVAHFVLTDPNSAVSETALRTSLADKFPAYMIPSRFMAIDRLPVDVHGKVSRNELRPPDDQRPALDQAFVAPRTNTEKKVAAVWCELLNLREVGLEDDFFELGGDSMLALTLPMLVEEKLGRKLSDSVVLQARTVQQMARLIDESVHGACLVSMQAGGTRPPVFFIHAHTGRVLEYRDVSNLLGPDIPFYALQPVGMDGAEKPLTSIEDMASRYIREIREVHPAGPFTICGYCAGGLIAYEIGRQIREGGEDEARIVLIETDFPRQKYWRRFLPRRSSADKREIGHANKVASAGQSAVQAAIDLACLRYKPPRLGGDIVIVSVESPEGVDTRWETMVAGKLERVILPRRADRHDYQHVFHEPYLTLLADAIRDLQAWGETSQGANRSAAP